VGGKNNMKMFLYSNTLFLVNMDSYRQSSLVESPLESRGISYIKVKDLPMIAKGDESLDYTTLPSVIRRYQAENPESIQPDDENFEELLSIFLS